MREWESTARTKSSSRIAYVLWVFFGEIKSVYKTINWQTLIYLYWSVSGCGVTSRMLYCNLPASIIIFYHMQIMMFMNSEYNILSKLTIAYGKVCKYDLDVYSIWLSVKFLWKWQLISWQQLTYSYHICVLVAFIRLTPRTEFLNVPDKDSIAYFNMCEIWNSWFGNIWISVLLTSLPWILSPALSLRQDVNEQLTLVVAAMSRMFILLMAFTWILRSSGMDLTILQQYLS